MILFSCCSKFLFYHVFVRSWFRKNIWGDIVYIHMCPTLTTSKWIVTIHVKKQVSCREKTQNQVVSLPLLFVNSCTNVTLWNQPLSKHKNLTVTLSVVVMLLGHGNKVYWGGGSKYIITIVYSSQNKCIKPILLIVFYTYNTQRYCLSCYKIYIQNRIDCELYHKCCGWCTLLHIHTHTKKLCRFYCL